MIARLKRFQCWAHALIASTATPARTVPLGRLGERRRHRRRSARPACLRRSGRRAPATRSAAPAPGAPDARSRRFALNTPPRKTGESTIERTSSRSSVRNSSPSPSRSAVMISLGPLADLRVRRRDAEVPVVREPGVDAAVPRGSGRSRPRTSWPASHRRSAAASPNRGDQLVEVAPERVHEAAVAAARPAAADVLFEEHDVEAGVELLQEPRRPHARCTRRRGSRRRPSCRCRAPGRARPRTPAGRAPRGATSCGRRRAGSRAGRSWRLGSLRVGRALRLLPWEAPPSIDGRFVRDARRRARPPAQLGGHRGTRSARPRARCCAPSGSPRTTSASRRSAWRRSGTR